jgi:hypothetical protein
LTYSGSATDVRDWLAFIAKFDSDNVRAVGRFKAELKKALKALKSDAARRSGKAGWRISPAAGKFIRKNQIAA